MDPVVVCAGSQRPGAAVWWISARAELRRDATTLPYRESIGERATGCECARDTGQSKRQLTHPCSSARPKSCIRTLNSRYKLLCEISKTPLNSLSKPRTSIRIVSIYVNRERRARRLASLQLASEQPRRSRHRARLASLLLLDNRQIRLGNRLLANLLNQARQRHLLASPRNRPLDSAANLLSRLHLPLDNRSRRHSRHHNRHRQLSDSLRPLGQSLTRSERQHLGSRRSPMLDKVAPLASPHNLARNRIPLHLGARQRTPRPAPLAPTPMPLPTHLAVGMPMLQRAHLPMPTLRQVLSGATSTTRRLVLSPRTTIPMRPVLSVALETPIVPTHHHPIRLDQMRIRMPPQHRALSLQIRRHKTTHSPILLVNLHITQILAHLARSQNPVLLLLQRLRKARRQATHLPRIHNRKPTVARSQAAQRRTHLVLADKHKPQQQVPHLPGATRILPTAPNSTQPLTATSPRTWMVLWQHLRANRWHTKTASQGYAGSTARGHAFGFRMDHPRIIKTRSCPPTCMMRRTRHCGQHSRKPVRLQTALCLRCLRQGNVRNGISRR